MPPVRTPSWDCFCQNMGKWGPYHKSNPTLYIKIYHFLSKNENFFFTISDCFSARPQPPIYSSNRVNYDLNSSSTKEVWFLVAARSERNYSSCLFVISSQWTNRCLSSQSIHGTQRAGGCNICKTLIAFWRECKILQNEVHIMEFWRGPFEIWQSWQLFLEKK